MVRCASWTTPIWRGGSSRRAAIPRPRTSCAAGSDGASGCTGCGISATGGRGPGPGGPAHRLAGPAGRPPAGAGAAGVVRIGDVPDGRAGDPTRRRAPGEAASRSTGGEIPKAVPPREPEPELGRLAECLDGLPARERSVILMTFYDASSGDETARALGVSTGNARVIRHRALARLRSCLEAV